MNIFLESRIWSDSFDYFKYQLDNAKDKEINLYISCVGGNVDAGFAIANYIEGVNAAGKQTIKTHILSNADSIATVIFLAPEPENRSIVESSTMFIHDPRFMDMWDVTSDIAKKAVEDLTVQEDRIANYYVKKVSGLSKDEAHSLMKGEKTLSAAEMVGYGIVNEVKPSFNIAALKTNFNTNNMSLFGKKEKPLNNVSLTQGENEVSAVHEGDLVEGAEMRRIGEGEALNGEFVSGQSTLTIKDNKVEKIEAIAVETNESPSVMDERIGALEASVDKILDAVEAFKGQSSTHVPAKANVNNEGPKDVMRAAKGESRARQVDNGKAAREARANRAKGLK